MVLDAHMNVTVHDCYETSICNPVSEVIRAVVQSLYQLVFLTSAPSFDLIGHCSHICETVTEILISRAAL